MSRVLLTTVFRPFGVENKYNKKGDEFLLDYLASRLTREPGLFSLSSYVPNSSVHVVGANLPVPARVLEFPSEEEFLEEIKKGYEYVGISFVIKGFGKVAKMIAMVRKHAPRSKVILGGFGTALHDVESLGADYVCRGEGVRFMRQLLGHPADSPLVHPRMTAEITLKCFQDHAFLGRETIGLVTSGFGCPNACEFCSTSAFFGHENVRFLEGGRDIYRVMCEMSAAGPERISNFLIFEEDFMLYRDKVEELGRCIERHEGPPLGYACFASVKALSEHDFEALAARGLRHVWIGVESIHAPFEKREGRDIRSIFEDLHRLGVTTTGSLILGLDHHTPGQLSAEIDFLASLRPSTAQISSLMPADGTPLRRRLEEEKRIRAVGYKDADLFSEVIRHPAFQPGEIQAAILDGYRRLYEAIGPAVYRILETWLCGYKELRGSPQESLRRRAELYARDLKNLLPVFLRTGRYLPNDAVRAQVRETLDEVAAELGPPTSTQEAWAELIGRVFALEQAKRRHLEEEPVEPELSTRDYLPRLEAVGAN